MADSDIQIQDEVQLRALRREIDQELIFTDTVVQQATDACKEFAGENDPIMDGIMKWGQEESEQWSKAKEIFGQISEKVDGLIESLIKKRDELAEDVSNLVR